MSHFQQIKVAPAEISGVPVLGFLNKPGAL
jgi:hypothetical protein